MSDLIRLRTAAAFAVVTVMLMLAAMTYQISACAAKNTGTDYIVKYKECAVWMSKDSSMPFDVVSEDEMQRLDHAGLLEWYEPDGEMTLLDEPAAPLYTEDKWDLALIRADDAFENNYLGQNVRVGIVDSGINPHEDIAGHLLEGCSYIEGDNPDNTVDNYGHGTYVAGLVSGYGKNGYIGVAPEADIIPLKITDGKGVTVSAVCRAIYGGINDYNCDILNLSLGINTESKSLKEAVEYAWKKEVVIVSAVGNNGNTAKLYPAAYDTVIGVGAVDSGGTWFYHSNYNDSVFVTAPGVNVKTVGKYGGYELRSGTSFSAPYVTAAAAVMLSIDDTLTPSDIMEILAVTAADKGDRGYDEYYGAGILNLGGCVRYLTGTVCRLLPVTGAASRVLNNSGTDVDCTYYLAEYDENGACVKVDAYELTIPANGSVEIEPPPENTIYGQFILDTKMVMPLTYARKSH